MIIDTDKLKEYYKENFYNKIIDEKEYYYSLQLITVFENVNLMLGENNKIYMGLN